MDNLKSQPPLDKLAPVLKEAQARLRLSDRAAVAEWSGATLARDGHWRLEFLGYEYLIDPVEWTVQRASAGSTPPSLTQSLILTYLSSADGTPPRDQWLGFRELPNGLFYAQAFQAYTGDVLVREVHGDTSIFQRAGQKLQGLPLAIGDAGYAFPVLPHLKLAVVMWSGDDEFPAQAQVLFQDTASHYLVTEGLAIVGSLLTGQIVKAAGA